MIEKGEMIKAIDSHLEHVLFSSHSHWLPRSYSMELSMNFNSSYL